MEQTKAWTTSLIFLFLITLFTEARALKEQLQQHRHHHHRRHGNSPVKLFVFGDSYADTGNCRKSVPEPYGITFPGKPAGRFSDGRVLTDYIASYWGIKSPISYRYWRESVKRSSEAKLQYGMNFAHGGTGVFNTLVDEPNMTTQVKFFQQLVEEKVFAKHDLNSSMALVSLAGNDYATFLVNNGDLKDLSGLTKSIIEELAKNLKLILGLGVAKIAVTAMEPMGCLPQLSSFSSYKNCSESWNSASKFHNQLLQQDILQNFNNESKRPVIFTLDLYTAFLSALMNKQNHSGNIELMNSLQPCCVGVSGKYFCGNVDDSGKKKYTVCKNPELSFFWDNIHPSQNGWHAVFSALKSSLRIIR